MASSRITSADLDALSSALRPLGDAATQAAARTFTGVRQPNSQPLGANTGAPPRTQIFQAQISSVGQRIVGPDKFSRQVVITVPNVAFGVVLGFNGRPDPRGSPVPPLIPYEIVIPGSQELWAVTPAPVFIPIQVQVGPLLGGDLERRWDWGSV